MKKKFYVIYQITNLVNGKIYIGKHKTNRLDDNYMGSGKYLHNAFKKYGLENFIMTILFYLQNEEEMNLLEKIVVTKEFCAREDVYNIKEGGDGGWDYVNLSSGMLGNTGWRRNKTLEENHLISVKGGLANKTRWENLLPSEREQICQNISRKVSIWNQNNPGYFAGENNPMFGRIHTQETRNKISNSKQGNKNNRYGSKWYYDPITFESHSFLPNEVIPKGWIKGRKLKKNLQALTAIQATNC